MDKDGGCREKKNLENNGRQVNGFVRGLQTARVYHVTTLEVRRPECVSRGCEQGGGRPPPFLQLSGRVHAAPVSGSRSYRRLLVRGPLPPPSERVLSARVLLHCHFPDSDSPASSFPIKQHLRLPWVHLDLPESSYCWLATLFQVRLCFLLVRYHSTLRVWDQDVGAAWGPSSVHQELPRVSSSASDLSFYLTFPGC